MEKQISKTVQLRHVFQEWEGEGQGEEGKGKTDRQDRKSYAVELQYEVGFEISRKNKDTVK